MRATILVTWKTCTKIGIDRKKVKVCWFHHKQEVMCVIPRLDPQPREIVITSHVQVISAECIDGPVMVLTPKHYEKCLVVVTNTLSSGIHLCCRQFKNNKVKPFILTKLHGYPKLKSLLCNGGVGGLKDVQEV